MAPNNVEQITRYTCYMVMDADQKESIINRPGARHRVAGDYSDQYIRDMLRSMANARAHHDGFRKDCPVPSIDELARMIDHTVLKPDTTEADVRAVCTEAKKHCFAAVCVPQCYVSKAARWMQGTEVAVCTVVGFPLGANRAEVKAAEAAWAIRDGATEIDMVIGIGRLKSGQYDQVEEDIRTVVDTVREMAGEQVLVKAIIETALLTDKEKVMACILAQNGGVDYVKTATGFAEGGATEADVSLIRQVVGSQMGVKASGGIRTLEKAVSMVYSGATRIGASASVDIIKGRSCYH